MENMSHRLIVLNNCDIEFDLFESASFRMHTGNHQLFSSQSSRDTIESPRLRVKLDPIRQFKPISISAIANKWRSITS